MIEVVENATSEDRTRMGSDHSLDDSLERWLEAVRATAAGGMPGGGRSPYKPLLLAAVLVRIVQGKQAGPEVRLDSSLRSLYEQLRRITYPEWPHGDDLRQPFARLAPEVWRLQPREEQEAELEKLLGAGARADWRALAKTTDCALLPPAVHRALRSDSEFRTRVADVLLVQLADRGADTSGLQILAGLLSVEAVEPREPVESPGSEGAAAAYPDLEALLESTIEDFLVSEWDETPFAQRGVRLYTNARGEVVGQQYPAGRWNIDLLGGQEDERSWWVIELKRGRASDRVVGQVGRYMGWIERYVSRPGEGTRGVILAREISTELEHACRAFEGVEAWTFDRDLRVHAA